MKKIVLIFVAIFITILMLFVIFGDFKVASSKIECTTANTNTCTNTDTDTVINDYIDNFCDETKCSSVSVVVMQDGKITIYGDEDALYQIGSMTKAFTGLAVLKLINEKVLSEDDIISDHIKGFTAYYEKEVRDITIGQLLTHTSGYTNKETDYPSALEGMSLRAWTDTISGSELRFAPGTGYSYSNVNYNLLGAVIEESTGVSYKEYMEKDILTPLGLADTYVGTPDDGDVVSGSRLMFRRSIPYDIPVIEGRIPAGYMYSSASDMARWMQIWTGADMTVAGDCDTNKDKAKDNADIPIEYKQLVLDVKAHLSCDQDYYAGWEYLGEAMGHSGGTPNYSSRIIFSQNKNIGVCVLTNLNVAASTDSLCDGIYAYIMNSKGAEHRTGRDTEHEIGNGTDKVTENGSHKELGSEGGSEIKSGIVTDVWTVFDIVFTGVFITGIVILIGILIVKYRGILIVSGVVLATVLIALCIVMPIIFGAGLYDILCIWAPYSMMCGMGILAADIVAIRVRLLRLKAR